MKIHLAKTIEDNAALKKWKGISRRHHRRQLCSPFLIRLTPLITLKTSIKPSIPQDSHTPTLASPEGLTVEDFPAVSSKVGKAKELSQTKKSTKTNGPAKATQPPAHSKQKGIQLTNTNAKNTLNIREEIVNAVKRVPSIVTYGMNNKEKTEQLTKVLGHSNFQMETVNKTCTLIRCNTVHTQQLVLNELKNKVNHHTPHEERKLSVVLRNLSPTYDATDIKDALEGLKLHISVHNVSPYVTDTSARQKRNTTNLADST